MNPTLLTLARQRGEIDCGGLEFIPDRELRLSNDESSSIRAHPRESAAPYFAEQPIPAPA